MRREDAVVYTLVLTALMFVLPTITWAQDVPVHQMPEAHVWEWTFEAELPPASPLLSPTVHPSAPSNPARFIRAPGNDPVEDGMKSSRFFTGAVLLGGMTVIGTGVGLASGEPGYGLMIGFGAGMVTIGSFRAFGGL